MDSTVRTDADRILVLDAGAPSRLLTCDAIARDFPSAFVEAASSLEELRAAFARGDFDIVILDDAVTGANPIELLHELRMRENEPSILLVSGSSDPNTIAELYNHGCQRCLMKSDGWQPEINSAIRQSLRYRKVQEQNRELHSRLVEANMLLEEKNKRLDEFSSTVAHDIRGPLAGLSMKLDFVLERFGADLDPGCSKLLSTGRISIERLNGMVASMYEYAKLGSQASRMGELDVERLATEVFAEVAGDRSGAVRFTVEALPKVWGSEPLLRRLFQNLFQNAIKYNDSARPAIAVKATRQEVRHFGRMVEICVEDNGRGIPADDLQNVFRMFHRGSSACREPDGAGIGLAVVQRVVELHYGRVRAVSAPGAGSSFLFTLPLRISMPGGE